MSFVTLLTFIAAAIAIISVPGPTTTMIVAFGLETAVVLMSDWLGW